MAVSAQGVCLPRVGGVCLGVGIFPGRGLPRGCVCLRGVCPGGCLPRGGMVPAHGALSSGGVYTPLHAGIHTPL